MQTETKKAGTGMTFEEWNRKFWDDWDSGSRKGINNFSRVGVAQACHVAWCVALASVAGAEKAGEFVPTNHEPLPGVTLWNRLEESTDRDDCVGFIKVDGEATGYAISSEAGLINRGAERSCYSFPRKRKIDHDPAKLAEFAPRVRAERAAKQAGAEKDIDRADPCEGVKLFEEKTGQFNSRITIDGIAAPGSFNCFSQEVIWADIDKITCQIQASTIPGCVPITPAGRDALVKFRDEVRAKRKAEAEKAKSDWSRIVTRHGEITLWNLSTSPDSEPCFVSLSGKIVAVARSDSTVGEPVATWDIYGDELVPNQWPLPPDAAERIDAFLDAHPAPEPAKQKPWDAESASNALRYRIGDGRWYYVASVTKNGLHPIQNPDLSCGFGFLDETLGFQLQLAGDPAIYGPYQNVVADGGKGGGE